MSVNVSAVTVRAADGSDTSLGAYAGQVLLIVNVASRCGFTKQYAGLQALQDSYGPKGLRVLGFPCNDFGAQEPGSLEEIKTFWIKSWYVMSKVLFFIHWKISFIPCELSDTWPFIWGWSTSYFEYLCQLIVIIFPWEQWSLCHYLSKNTSN